MYFDSHTHLNDDKLFSNRENHLTEFFTAGGKGLVNVGVNHEWNIRAIEIATKRNSNHGSRENIFASIGIHPTETIFGNIKNTADINTAIIKLEEMYHKNHAYIVAIGECGNDAHHGKYDKTRSIQQELFHAQCFLARKLDLPIMIHSRDNFKDAYEIIRKFSDLKVYYHCRGYGPEEIIKLAKTLPDLWIGFCGNISYPKAHRIRESFQKVLEITGPQFLLETDAPYLSPQTKRGTINAPKNVIDIYYYISNQFKIPLLELQQGTKKSFQSLYSRKKL